MVESITIKNIETEEKLTMDKMNTKNYVLEYVDWGQATVNQYTSKFVNQVGISVNGTSFKERNIEIVGIIIANSEEEMAERKKFLNSFINPQKQYEAIYKQYKIVFYPLTSIKYSNTDDKDNNEVICKFKISGICPNPLFALADIETLELEKIQSAFKFPFHTSEDMGAIFGIEIISDNKRRVIVNRGQVDIGVRFKFVNATGNTEEVVYPVLYNFTTGQKFEVKRVMWPSQYIEVDTNIGSKSIIGGYLWATQRDNYFKYKTLESDWITLKVGENLIGYGAERNENLLTVILEVDNRFMEVQECY